jgi:hypothetical protein
MCLTRFAHFDLKFPILKSQHASCEDKLQDAYCEVQYASCDVQYASCDVQYASCDAIWIIFF